MSFQTNLSKTTESVLQIFSLLVLLRDYIRKTTTPKSTSSERLASMSIGHIVCVFYISGFLYICYILCASSHSQNDVDERPTSSSALLPDEKHLQLHLADDARR